MKDGEEKREIEVIYQQVHGCLCVRIDARARVWALELWGFVLSGMYCVDISVGGCEPFGPRKVGLYVCAYMSECEV